jgi:SecD/SecF fusion protein
VFGEQIVRNAIWAILLSFLVLVVYLTIRFEYKLALPALLSVVQDVFFAVSIYSLTGREVTSATVAALLAILGYSLYDVVIVFDRIRENVPLMRKSTYRQIVNRSVHETLNRSLITSLTTLLPLIVLYFFGGDTLKDFAFALIVGILTGGVSSIVISAPLAAIWKDREPEFRKKAGKAQRRALARVTSDADVVDLDVLERAEAGLQAELAMEEAAEAEPEPRALGAGRRDDEPTDAASPADDRPAGGGDDTAAAIDDNEPADAAGGDAPADGAPAGTDSDEEPQVGASGRRRRESPGSARPRRHQQVQRRKRR